MQPIIVVSVIIVVFFSFTTSMNCTYAVSWFTMNYPDGWSMQEVQFGYLFTSPDNQIQFLAEVIPNESIQSLFSTTDMYQIVNNAFLKDKSQHSNVKVLLQPVVSGEGDYRRMQTTYSIDGFEKQLILDTSKTVLYYYQIFGAPQYITQYSGTLDVMSKSINVDATQLPEGQRIISNIDKIQDDTLSLGTNFGGSNTGRGPIDTWIDGMNKLGESTPLQDYYEDQRRCIEMKRLGC